MLSYWLKIIWRSGGLVAKSCPTLCNSVDCSPPGSSVHGILQARILEWVVIPFSRGSSQPRDRTQVSYIAGRFLTNWATRKAQNIFGVGANGWFHLFHLLASLQNDLLGHALLFTHCLCLATTGCFIDLSNLACPSRVIHPLPPALPKAHKPPTSFPLCGPRLPALWMFSFCNSKPHKEASGSYRPVHLSNSEKCFVITKQRVWEG